MFSIRKMRREDIGQVAELERRIFPDPWSERAIRETEEQDHTMILTAFDDGRMIGYLILYFALEDGEIARVAVDEEYRRQGVATRILNELELLCEDNGVSKLLLDVRESNAAAIRFYEGCGFVRDGIRKKYYQAPVENAVLMSLELGRRLEDEEAVPTRNAGV